MTKQETEQIFTEAMGSALRNKKLNEDFVLGYLSSKIELTDELKSEVKKSLENIKDLLVV